LKSDNNQINLVEYMWKWRKALFITTLGGAILAVIFSLMMQDYFKSVAIVFPAKTSSVDYQLSSGADKITDLGEEEQAEQLLQILKSAEIRDSIINTYDLMKHYEIDPKSDFAKTKLHKRYNKNISVDRTRYGSIEVEVWDTDPKIASRIANDIVRLGDTVFNRMIMARVMEPYLAVKRQWESYNQEIIENTKILSHLADSGVVSRDQRMELFRNLIDAKKSGDPELVAYIQRRIDATDKYGAEYDAAHNLMDERFVQMAEFKAVLDQAKAGAYSKMKHHFPVEKAVPAERKEYPTRSLIVVIAAFSSFVLMLITLILRDKYLELKAKF
jgi:hypothetical protein